MTMHIKGTKTKSSDRVIPINQKILNLLGNNDVPFPFNANTVQHNFKKIIKKIGLDDKEITLHSLRHTYATRVLESGISPKILQKWLGHSSIKITMDIYSDIQSEFEKNEFLKLKISQND